MADVRTRVTLDRLSKDSFQIDDNGHVVIRDKDLAEAIRGKLAGGGSDTAHVVVTDPREGVFPGNTEAAGETDHVRVSVDVG